MKRSLRYLLLSLILILVPFLAQATEEPSVYLPVILLEEKPTIGSMTFTPTLPSIATVMVTPVSTPIPTHTPTPTSMPGPPILIIPEDGATLPQPVKPEEWVFKWEAKIICDSGIVINGPGNRQITYNVPALSEQVFHYTSDEYIPDDALGPWYWSVGVGCPSGSNHSETYTFFVEARNSTKER